MKLSEATESAIHHVLLFGPPKSGKTQLAGELSKKFNLIWFDLENGHATLFKRLKEEQERIELIALPDTRAYPIAIETMLKVIKGKPGTICEAHGKWDCGVCKKSSAPSTPIHLNSLSPDTIVVIDSITQLTSSAISYITLGKDDDYKMQTDDWGHLSKLMDIFFSHVQNAPFNIVAISHETEVETEDGSKNKLVPTAGSRNFSRNSAKFFGEVIYCEVKNKRHIAASSTIYQGNILTGSRTGAVLEKEQEPSLIPIFSGDIVPVPVPPSNGEKAVSHLSLLKEKLSK